MHYARLAMAGKATDKEKDKDGKIVYISMTNEEVRIAMKFADTNEQLDIWMKKVNEEAEKEGYLESLSSFLMNPTPKITYKALLVGIGNYDET